MLFLLLCLPSFRIFFLTWLTFSSVLPRQYFFPNSPPSSRQLIFFICFSLSQLPQTTFIFFPTKPSPSSRNLPLPHHSIPNTSSPTLPLPQLTFSSIICLQELTILLYLLATRATGAVQAMIYKKVLRLKTGGERLSAQVINFSNNDMERLFEACISCVFVTGKP